MARDICTGQTVSSISENSKRIKDMVRVGLSGRMGVSTRAAGTKESSTEPAFTLTIMESSAKDSGWRASARNGSTET